MTIDKNLTIENAKIRFRNFSGKEGRFNPAGQRNFCVFLDTPIAKRLENDGWNIRWLTPRDPEDEKQGYLQVSVSYKNMPPKIVVISNKSQTTLDENSVNVLDWAEIQYVDLIVRPYNWEVNNKTGTKAYAKSMYITLVDDDLAAKYRDVPDAGSVIVDEDDV
jgi:hypothetical protein